MTKGSSGRQPRRFWTDEERARVNGMYATRPTKEIAALLGRSVLSVYQAANNLGLGKSAEFLAGPESGILRKGETRPESVATQFKKGQVPANKGLRRPGWSPGRMKETQFKKGQLSGFAARNLRPIGTVLADHEGYLRIKVRERGPGEAPGWSKSIWPLLHHQVWEQHKGPIPPKHVVIFKDDNSENCAIENLDCISMADNARRNSMWNPDNMPRELADVIQLNGALKRKIRRLNGKEQNQ